LKFSCGIGQFPSMNPVPVTVIAVPPVTTPAFGSTAVTTGSGTGTGSGVGLMISHPATAGVAEANTAHGANAASASSSERLVVVLTDRLISEKVTRCPTATHSPVTAYMYSASPAVGGPSAPGARPSKPA